MQGLWRLEHEHIYWDQAGVLAELGLLDDTALPVARASDQAKKTLHPNSVPSNNLLRRVGLWKDEYGQEDL